MNCLDWGRGVRKRVAQRDVPRAVLSQARLRDGDGCVVCRRQGLTPPTDEPIELDHKQPLARGGDNHWTNLQFLCRSHNRARGTRKADLSAPPAWVGRLARDGQLVAHVARCRARGLLWTPLGARLASQLSALLSASLPKGLVQ